MLACELSVSKLCARLMVRGIMSMPMAVIRFCCRASSSSRLRAGYRYDIRLQEGAHFSLALHSGGLSALRCEHEVVLQLLTYTAPLCCDWC